MNILTSKSPWKYSQGDVQTILIGEGLISPKMWLKDKYVYSKSYRLNLKILIVDSESPWKYGHDDT